MDENDDIAKAYQFRESLKPRADSWNGPAPMWYGWAIFDAYIAGLKAGRRDGAEQHEAAIIDHLVSICDPKLMDVLRPAIDSVPLPGDEPKEPAHDDR